MECLLLTRAVRPRVIVRITRRWETSKEERVLRQMTTRRQRRKTTCRFDFRAHVDTHVHFCIFSHAHQKHHAIRKQTLVSDWELFNKCNCKTTRPRGRCESTPGAIEWIWALSACTWHQKVLTCDQSLLSVAPPSSFRFWQSGIMFQWFHFHLHKKDPSFTHDLLYPCIF